MDKKIASSPPLASRHQKGKRKE
jgi:hypothetical protein